MKSIGKFLLLLLVYCSVFLLTGTVSLVLFSFLSTTPLGIFILEILTGSLPEIASVLISCAVSISLCSSLAEKMGAFRQLYSLGIVIIIFSALFAALNLYYRENIIPNMITLFYGYYIVKDSKKTK